MRKIIAALLAAASIGPVAAPAQASPGHWCNDRSVYASNHTSCAFAGNIANTYWNRFYGRGAARAWVYSPVTHRYYLVQYMTHMGAMQAWVVGQKSSIWVGF